MSERNEVTPRHEKLRPVEDTLRFIMNENWACGTAHGREVIRADRRATIEAACKIVENARSGGKWLIGPEQVLGLLRALLEEPNEVRPRNEEE